METPVTKKKSPVRYIVLALLLLAGGFFGYTRWQFSRTHQTTDNAQVETSLMPVLPRVSGYIKSISVADYDSVRPGQLLVELDDAEMQAQLAEMEADYRQSEADASNAKAALNNAMVSLKVNKGNIELSEIKMNKAEKDLNRDQNLIKEEAITQRQLEDSKYNYESSQQQVSNAKSDLTSAESRIAVLQAGIQKAQAALDLKRAKIDQQKLKISYTNIAAPISGKLGKKNISIGQFVQAGTPLFTIVNDSTYWIVANFKESQIDRLRPGMPVNIKLDAYPKLELKGKIESLSDATGAKFALLPPDNASGNFVKVTQRIPVKVSIDDLNKYREIMRAGLSAYIEIAL